MLSRTDNEAAGKLHDIFSRLLAFFGPRKWWPGETPWEVCVGAVLTQNTNWSNVEKAIANLKRVALLPSTESEGLTLESAAELAAYPPAELAELIRPSGYFNIKAKRLASVAEWWGAEAADIGRNSLDTVRESLLAVNGVGPETADSILLYAFNMPTFVVDAYTKRIMARAWGTPLDIPYEELRSFFMDNLPKDVQMYNEYHALFVELAKRFCLKKGCDALGSCPLAEICLDRSNACGH